MYLFTSDYDYEINGKSVKGKNGYSIIYKKNENKFYLIDKTFANKNTKKTKLNNDIIDNILSNTINIIMNSIKIFIYF